VLLHYFNLTIHNSHGGKIEFSHSYELDVQGYKPVVQGLRNESPSLSLKNGYLRASLPATSVSLSTYP